jgi:hypothetical protein
MFDTALVRATLKDRATASSTEKVLVSGDVARDSKDEEEGLTEIDTTSFEVTYGQPSNSRQKAVVFPATQASSDEPTPATKRRHSPASGAMEGPSFSDDSKGKLKRNESPRDEREGSSDRNTTPQVEATQGNSKRPRTANHQGAAVQQPTCTQNPALTETRKSTRPTAGQSRKRP